MDTDETRPSDVPSDVEVVKEAPEAALRHGVLTLNDVIAQSVTVIAPAL